MNRRKLLSRRDEYLKSIEDSPEQTRASVHFYNQLRNYYKRKWGVNLQLPRVNGIEVNLYKLYDAVKSSGGWIRVTNADKWYDVARDVLGLGDETVSADYCARLIYMRYLCKYEQFEQGADTDDHDNDMMGSRSRMRGYSLYVTSECPIQHSRREQNDDQLQYDKLIKSLASGLPNEVDFALNTCAIMSSPGPFAFDLDRHSGLITLIVGQAGVFDDNSDFLQAEFVRNQLRTTKRDFAHFWSNAGIEDADVMKIFPMIKSNKYSKLDYQLFPLLKDEQHEQKLIETVEFRVKQVLDIIRNLSFEARNQPILANNWASLKFLIICLSTDIYELRNSALDALSELASQICLSTDLLTTILLRLLRTFLFSEDRILVMRSAEVIGALCVNPENESIMCDFLETEVLRRLFELISAKDVLICVNTLDSLYNISESCRTLCERLAEVPRGIELLVNFCTIEASQFTTNGLYGIKVIEYQGGESMRPSTSYYHQQQQQVHARTLPAPLQPLPMGASSNRPQVVVSSKGDIASVATNKPILAAQLARPVMTSAQSVEYPKRESISMNGSQVQQIRIVNGNGEPITLLPASTTSAVNQLVKNEATESQQSTSNTVADETTSTVNAEEEDDLDDEEKKMEIDESANTEDVTVEKMEIVETVETKLVVDVQAKSTNVIPPKSSSTTSETIDVLNVDTEDEVILNGTDHPNGDNSNEHPVLNGVIKGTDQPVKNGNSTINEEEIKSDIVGKSTKKEDGPQLNGTLSPNHVKENGCVKASNGDEEEKPILNGAAKKSKSKAKKRPATETPPDSNGSPNTKKAKTTPNSKKKTQKNGYIEPEKSTETPIPPSAAQTVYVRIPNFMCEWDGCTNFFHTGSGMIYHILHEHIDAKENGESTNEETPSTSNNTTSPNELIFCRWPGCERTPRSRWSLITHLQENHCNENALNLSTRKRREIGDFNYTATIKQRLQEITPAANHPGYSKFAAYDAIRRHISFKFLVQAFNYLSRDITEDHQEGPVTKDLRLTSALILRNLAKHSAECRRRLRPHEGFLSYLSMSRLECGSALAQCLAALNPVDF